jgi:tRNA G18 (ribose-2'-O)-methylase SpoU
VIHRAGADDPRLEAYRHVGDPSWLAQRQLFVAEGRLVVERLLTSGEYELESIVVTPPALAALDAILAAVSCDVYLCEAAVLEGATGFNFHRGCLALARRPPARATRDLLTAHRLVALEGIGNPDNIGGIFRTAAALGAAGVVLDPTTGDPLYRKAIRTSMAATLRVPWVRLAAWPDGLDAFREAKFILVALTPHPSATTLDEFARTHAAADRLILMLGGEGPGLSPRALDLADARVRIPVDPVVNSLNVVVAAGIALERLRRSE